MPACQMKFLIGSRESLTRDGPVLGATFTGRAGRGRGEGVVWSPAAGSASRYSERKTERRLIECSLKMISKKVSSVFSLG